MTPTSVITAFVLTCAFSARPIPAGAQPIPGPAEPPLKTCASRPGAVYGMIFSKTTNEWDVKPPSLPRITNRERVEVCVEHFNFLRYTLSFDVTEEKSESYDYLTKLWTSVLSPSLAGVLGAVAAPQGVAALTPEQRFLIQLQAIYALATELDHAIGEQIAKYRLTGLEAEEAKTLATARGSIDGSLQTLNKAYADLQKLLLDPTQTTQFANAIGGTSKIYSVVTELYGAVAKRADVFLSMSEKTIGIEVRKVGTRSAGTRVTLRLVATGDGGAKTPMADVHYFVETTLPLVVHGGLTFAKLNDVSFEKVKRASQFSEEDLFQRTTDNPNTRALSMFLAWQFWSKAGTAAGSVERVGLLFSLGTDVRAPGKKVFAGPSLALFNRIVLTAGVSLGKEANGEAATLEPDVFRIVRERPATAFFFSLSTKVH